MHDIKVNPDESGNLFVHLTRTARVFSSGDAKGNLCVVHRFSSACAAHNFRLSFPSPLTQCTTWQDRGDIHVKCWTTNGRPIACCGHGLMACAALWRESVDKLTLPLTLSMNSSRVTVEPSTTDPSTTRLSLSTSTQSSTNQPAKTRSTTCRSTTSLPVTAQPTTTQHSTGSNLESLALRFGRVSTQRSQLPGWLDQFFPHRPHCCALAGGDSGYMVLEWPAQYDLRRLPVPGAHLAQVTQRAVIVTCLMSSASPMIHFRYFAPQYGTPEDSATGSAMRILAEYWQQQQSLTTLQAFQCSASGGCLQSTIERNHVVIGGSVKWE